MVQNIDQAIANLRIWLKQNPKSATDEQEVIAKYGKLFSPGQVQKISREQFKSFLLNKNNKHWDGIHRQGNAITSNMPKLRKALKVLVDEKQNVKDRLDFLFPRGKQNYIRGLGRAIVTPILMCVYPTKYGVYNSKVERGLKKIGLFPKTSKNSFAEEYLAVNKVLIDLARRYNLSLNCGGVVT